MFLQADNLYLRALEPSDLDFLYGLENDVSVWHVSNTVTPYSREVLRQYLEQAALDIYTTKQLRLLICTPGHQAAGAIDLYDFDPLHRRAGVGIVVSAAFRHQGLAASALGLLEDYCQEFLMLHQLYCSIGLENAASLHLFQNAGFKVSGRKQDWIKTTSGWEDVLDLQKIL